MIHPLILGKGQRLFPKEGPLVELRQVDTRTTTTGVVIVTYRPTEEGTGGEEPDRS
jgi:dihydrofolate reductase